MEQALFISSRPAMTRVSLPRSTSPLTTVVAAMFTPMVHTTQPYSPTPALVPLNMWPSGHLPHVKFLRPSSVTTDGSFASTAGVSRHSTPGKHGLSAHASKSTQPVVPVEPATQGK